MSFLIREKYVRCGFCTPIEPAGELKLSVIQGSEYVDLDWVGLSALMVRATTGGERVRDRDGDASFSCS